VRWVSRLSYWAEVSFGHAPVLSISCSERNEKVVFVSRNRGIKDCEMS
jgi:hypothetical protein